MDDARTKKPKQRDEKRVLYEQKEYEVEKVKDGVQEKKRNTVMNLNNRFVTELKSTNPRQFYQMCKKVGAVDQLNSADLTVRSLGGLR